MDFMERMKKTLDRGVEASREFLGRAGDTAKDLSEKGVLRLEIRELEGRGKKEFARLGQLVFDHFVKQDKSSITAKNQEVTEILNELKSIEDEIAIRENKLSVSGDDEAEDSQEADEPESN